MCSLFVSSGSTRASVHVAPPSEVELDPEALGPRPSPSRGASRAAPRCPAPGTPPGPRCRTANQMWRSPGPFRFCAAEPPSLNAAAGVRSKPLSASDHRYRGPAPSDSGSLLSAGLWQTGLNTSPMPSPSPSWLIWVRIGGAVVVGVPQLRPDHRPRARVRHRDAVVAGVAAGGRRLRSPGQGSA